MAKIEIEDYRNWTIYFNTNDQEFKALSGYDNLEKASKSFTAIKTQIDDFIKNNTIFKPFQVENHKYNGTYSQELVTIIGRRKDNRFIYEDSKGEKHQVSEYEENNFHFYNKENDTIYEQMKLLDQKVKVLENNRKVLGASLKIKTLKNYREEVDGNGNKV